MLKNGEILLQIFMPSATQIRLPFALGKPLKSEDMGGEYLKVKNCCQIGDLSDSDSAVILKKTLKAFLPHPEEASPELKASLEKLLLQS